MSVVFRPFRGYRPRPELAQDIASPPYDVLNSDEARFMAKGHPLSFLHVVKPEIDLDRSIDLYDDRVYAKGKENLDRTLEHDFIRDETPCFYLYQQQMGDHVQVGIVGCVSIDDYMADRIKKHEHTRPDKEADRTRHVDTMNANAGPVFLTYRAVAAIDALVADIRKTEPTYDFESLDGVGHTLWLIENDDATGPLQDAFKNVPCLYVADGHHRTASAANVGIQRRAANPSHTGDEEYNFFMAVLFPHDQLNILDYNRVVKDLGGMDEATFLDKVSRSFDVAKSDGPFKPEIPKTMGMHLTGQWYSLKAKEGTYPTEDPVASLDVAILQNNLLASVLGIEDPRKDKRIDFVGGIRGMIELERRVKDGWAVAFSLYPTSVSELMAIADAGEIMPPKSTWFEPKLRSGLVVHTLD